MACFKLEACMLAAFLLPLVFLQNCDASAAVDMFNVVPKVRRTMGSEPGELDAEPVAPSPTSLLHAAKDAKLMPASPPEDPGMCIYTIVIETGELWGAGTDSVISLRLQNRKGEGVYCESLDTPDKFNNFFERGCTDIFRMIGKCVHHICQMTLYTDDSGWFPSWFPASVEVFVTSEFALSSEADYQKWRVMQWLPTDDDANSLFLVRDHCAAPEA